MPLSSSVGSVPTPASATAASAGTTPVRFHCAVPFGAIASSSLFVLSVKYRVPFGPVAMGEIDPIPPLAGYVNATVPVVVAEDLLKAVTLFVGAPDSLRT